MHRLVRRAALILSALAALGGTRAFAVAPPVEKAVPGHVLVRVRGDAPASIGGVRRVRAIGDGVHLYAGDPAAAARILDGEVTDPAIEWAEPDRIRRGHGTPNDPRFAEQWSFQMAHVPAAWARSEGSARVVVAIIDSGMRPHPDLDAKWLAGFDFITAAANAGDGDGRDDDPRDEGTTGPSSSGLHGMHVGGIAGAQTNNKVGIAGVGWGCLLLPVRVLGVDHAQGSDSDIADAIRWSAGIHVEGVADNPQPAAVLNLSFGGPGGSRTLQAAINAAVGLGAIVVASAGNDAADTDLYAPAGLDHVIAVGAVGRDGKLAVYSNRGPRVDLVAPGGDFTQGGGILSTMHTMMGDGYEELTGTSQAAPHVSGVAALMRAIDPTLGGDRARDLLRGTADPTGRCVEGCGGGLLDAGAATAAVAAACADGHCDVRTPAVWLRGGCGLHAHRRDAGAAIPIIVGAIAIACARRRQRRYGGRSASPSG